MSTADEPIILGPFTGGLADARGSFHPTQGDPSELTICENLELNLDGYLQTRPKTYIDLTTSQWAPGFELTRPPRFVGMARTNSGSGTILQYIFANAHQGTWWNTTDGVFKANPWTFISGDAFYAGSAQQIDEDNVVITDEDGDGSGGIFNMFSNTFTPDAAIPHGLRSVIFKSRIWVIQGCITADIGSMTNRNRIWFSDPLIDSTPTWPAENFIDIDPGSGDMVMDMIVYNDSLMIFKEESTWVLAFDADPADAVLQCINPNIGATRTECVGQYQDSVYVLHHNSLYEVVNYNFQKINDKLEFSTGTWTGSGSIPYSSYNIKNLTIVQDRVLVRYAKNYYCFNLLTRTWSTWSKIGNFFARQFLPVILYPNFNSDTGDIYNDRISYIAGSTNFGIGSTYSQEIYLIDTEEIETGRTDTVSWKLKTMDQDFGDSVHYKKMKWWGVDVSIPDGNYLTTEVDRETPYSVNSLDGPLQVQIPPDDQSGNIKFYKRAGGFRFKSCSFIVSGVTDTTVAKHYVGRIVAVVSRQQTVSKSET